MASVEERFIKVVAESTKREPSEINSDTRFIEDLGLDSMDVVELIIAMEEEFGDDGDGGLEISDEDAQKFAKVSDAIDYLKTQGVSD